MHRPSGCVFVCAQVSVCVCVCLCCVFVWDVRKVQICWLKPQDLKKCMLVRKITVGLPVHLAELDRREDWC